MNRHVAAALLVLVALPGMSSAARRSKVASCARASVHVVAKMTDAALRDLEACQRRRARGRAASCATPATAPPSRLGFAAARARLRVTYFCQVADGDTVSFLDARFGPNAFDGSGAARKVNLVDGLLLPGILTLLGKSSADVQGDVSLAGDRVGLACHDRLGTTLTHVVGRTVHVATRCALARRTSATGLDAACAARAQRAAFRTTPRVRAACARVGDGGWSTCLGADAAGCASSAAVDAGLAIARLALGPGQSCGDGIVEPQYGEACDDGNASNEDACTATCQPNVCGDGFLNPAAEQCDDGNGVDSDGCNTQCRSAVCGNAILEGDEQCDDGNTDPNDGCDQCKQVVVCGANGLTADVALPRGGLGGVRLAVAYPAALSIPGGGGDTDDSRFTDLTGDGGTFVVVDRDTNGDGVDDSVRVVYAVTGVSGFGPGDVFQLRFDCDAGSRVALDDLGCSVDQASDVAGNATSDVTCSLSHIE